MVNMEEINLSETAIEEKEQGRPSGAILSLALGKQRKHCWMFSYSKLKLPFYTQKDKYWNYGILQIIFWFLIDYSGI
jgi:hypothetical protein